MCSDLSDRNLMKLGIGFTQKTVAINSSTLLRLLVYIELLALPHVLYAQTMIVCGKFFFFLFFFLFFSLFFLSLLRPRVLVCAYAFFALSSFFSFLLFFFAFFFSQVVFRCVCVFFVSFVMVVFHILQCFEYNIIVYVYFIATFGTAVLFCFVFVCFVLSAFACVCIFF